MKLEFWSLALTSQAMWLPALQDYTQRINHYLPFQYVELPSPSGKKKSSDPLKAEADLVLSKVKPSDYLVLLDEGGKALSSVAFAKYLSQKQVQVPDRLVFLAGGPFGFHPTLTARSAEAISLSPMTFTHQMVRLIFLEQIYRACTINRGESYHHV